mgnify:FL=1|tara:strand:+ start:708 stop:914 length:207 start_codon:yes stop_codon:yes gene_type:complete
MKYLTKEYQTFMDKVQHDYNIHGDKYENCDPEARLIEHFNIDPHLAKKIYDEWILLVFTRMPWKPPED